MLCGGKLPAGRVYNRALIVLDLLVIILCWGRGIDHLNAELCYNSVLPIWGGLLTGEKRRNLKFEKYVAVFEYLV